MRKFKYIAITFLMLGLTGCKKEDIEPTQTVAPIEVVKTTEKAEIETTEAVKETGTALEIGEARPLDGNITVINSDEDGNNTYIIEETKVADDGSIKNEIYVITDTEDEYKEEKVNIIKDEDGNISSDNEVYNKYIDAQKDTMVPYDFESKDAEVTETLSVEEVNNLQQDVLDSMDEALCKDTLDMTRFALKIDVKDLAAGGHTEFSSITDEMIDNMPEEELWELNAKVVKAVRGY